MLVAVEAFEEPVVGTTVQVGDVVDVLDLGGGFYFHAKVKRVPKGLEGCRYGDSPPHPYLFIEASLIDSPGPVLMLELTDIHFVRRGDQ